MYVSLPMSFFISREPFQVDTPALEMYLLRFHQTSLNVSVHELLFQIGDPVLSIYFCDVILQLYQGPSIDQCPVAFTIAVAHLQQVVIIEENVVELLFFFCESRDSILLQFPDHPVFFFAQTFEKG